MSLKFDYQQALPELAAGIRGLDKIAAGTGLAPSLRELVKIRASQINGCAFCIDLHTKSARAAGETERRIYALNAWRETPFFTDAERAVLALTEAVTEIAKNGLSDEIYDAVRAHFNEREFMGLIATINLINAWNRIAITTGLQPSAE